MSIKQHISYVIIFLMGFAISKSQNNVGIGTKKPDLTAIMDVADSNRGFMLPKTDTMSVINYVNSLSPNPGIQHGLTIWETNMRTIYIYNGLKQKWEAITSIQGPVGPTGITGPTGPRGDRGIATQWRDSALLPPIKRIPKPNNIPYYFETLGDTCGDFYHQTATGLVWVYDCIQNEWEGPIARWRNFGVPRLIKIQAPGLLEEPMPTSTAGDTLQLLGNLSYTILVPPDTVAYLWVTSEGNVQKKYVNYNDVNRIAFDFFMVDLNGVGSYTNNGQTVSVGPNNQIPFTTTSQFEKVPWEMSYTSKLEGKLSPPGNPLPSTDYNIWTIQTHYGQLFQTGNTIHPDSSRLIMLDNAGSVSNQIENFAVLNVFIIFERNTNAAYPY